MLLLSFSHSLCTSFITGDDSTADGLLDLLGSEEGGIEVASPHVIVDGCRLKQEIEPLHMGISRSDFLAGKTSTSCFEESGPLAGKSTRGSQEIGSRFGPSGLRRNTTPALTGVGFPLQTGLRQRDSSTPVPVTRLAVTGRTSAPLRRKARLCSRSEVRRRRRWLPEPGGSGC